jgi:hypothetical protein
MELKRKYLIIAVLPDFGFVKMTASMQNRERLIQIEERADEIKSFLSGKAQGVGAPMMDRERWDMFKTAFDAATVIDRAERVMASPVPETPEPLYMDYYKTENRYNYEFDTAKCFEEYLSDEYKTFLHML